MKKITLTIAVFIIAGLGTYFIFGPGKSSKVPTITIDKQSYQLLINDKPFLIKGVCYNPIPIGKDYEYNFWGDPGKPWLLDGKLMKQMGVNTVRFYSPGKNPREVREVIGDLYNKFGIHSLMGHFLGLWEWPPANYADKGFKEGIQNEVLEMVKLYKEEPGILMWVLGNENNYSFDQNIRSWSNAELDKLDSKAQWEAKAKIYYSFVNDLAKEIKKIDPNRPVVLGVGEVKSLHIAAEYATDFDVIGMIAYRGNTFGNIFRQIKQRFDKPFFFSEFGSDSFNSYEGRPDEETQVDFLKLQWKDIVKHSNVSTGVGNCLGGVVFEWTDEWWKGNENLPHTWSLHDESGQWRNVSYYTDAPVLGGLNMNEEWWGVVALDGSKKVGGNNARVPKKAYHALKSLWT